MKQRKAIVLGGIGAAIVLGGIGAAIVAGVALAGDASGQSYPAKPISIILPFPAGSGNDTVARIIGPKITEELHQPVIVDNRPGAGGVVAADLASRAAPDGYTLFLPSSSVAINMHSPRAKYDLNRDFAPISVVGELPFVLVVHASMPVASLKELVALAKRRPKELNFASSGLGGTGHLLGELLRTSTRIEITHVAYKGSGAAARELISGQVHMLFTNMSSMAPYVKAGRLKALGVSGSQRAAVLPDVPTMAEAGYPQLDIGTWFALVAPAATPRPIVTELNRRMVKILALPDVRTQFARQGVEPRPGSVEEASEYLKKDVARWGRILQDAGITLN